jgi:hypothetical protein
MSFLNGFFLFFLPLVLIPLIISLIFQRNRQKIAFPSTEIIEEILSLKFSSKSVFIRVKNLLRALILFFVILAFAGIMIGENRKNKEYVAYIDPSFSMCRFQMEKIFAYLNQNYRVKKIYFGSQIYGEGRNAYSFYPDSLLDALSYLYSQEKPKNIIIFSDGQKYSFGRSLKKIPPFQSVEFVLLKDNPSIRNIFVQDVSSFPMLAIRGEKLDFTIHLGGPISKDDRVQVFLNHKLAFSDKASSRVVFSRFPDESIKSGMNLCEVRLEGDSFNNDNVFYFPLLSLSKPSIYSGLDSPILNRVMNSIFPSFFGARKPDFADIIVDSSLTQMPRRQLVFLFCEDKKKIEEVFRKHFSFFPEFKDVEVSGALSGENPVFQMFQEVKLKLRFVDNKPDSLFKKAAFIGSMPLAYVRDNIIVFPFSLSENKDYLERSPLLVFLINDLLFDYYQKNYILKGQIKGKKFYDENGSLSSPEFSAGVFKEKESGKFFFQNYGKESKFEFYDEKDIRQFFSLGMQAKLHFTELILPAGKAENPMLGLILPALIMVLVIVLIFFELV